MIFYDFEVFEFDWLVVLIDFINRRYTTIINDSFKLKEYYQKHKNDIWIGYNSRHYDQYILKSILLDMNPKEVNDFIIVQDKPGWRYSDLFRSIQLYNYDVMLRTDRGLKVLEGMMGNRIKESSIPFDIKRKLTDSELQETVEYCTHDVEQTVEVFLKDINEFNAVMGLIEQFPEVLSLADISKTKAQISAKILECEYKSRNDEFDIQILPCIRLGKYESAKEHFLNPENHWYKRGTEKNEYQLEIAGLVHQLGWGGIHSARERYHNNGKDCLIFHVDVASFYPRLMIFHNLLTRNCKRPEKFKQIYEKRIALKKAGKKKEQAPLKVVINGTYGICKDKTSTAYDPRNANLICVNGQLMLIDLIEKLEHIPGFLLIQSNTDGLIVSIPDTDESFEQLDDICYEWESRCNMELEFDEITEIYQKDVNNYVFRFSNGKLERKGSYVKELSEIDYDLPIVNKAVVDFLMNRIPVEVTIGNCNDLKEFQQIKKSEECMNTLFTETNEYRNERFVVLLRTIFPME